MNETLTILEKYFENGASMIKEIKEKSIDSPDQRERIYQDMVLESVDIDDKEISIGQVQAWARVTKEYIQSHKPISMNAKRNKTFWGVHVIKYLCDFWKRDYPEKYINKCMALGFSPKTGRPKMQA